MLDLVCAAPLLPVLMLALADLSVEVLAVPSAKVSAVMLAQELVAVLALPLVGLRCLDFLIGFLHRGQSLCRKGYTAHANNVLDALVCGASNTEEILFSESVVSSFGTGMFGRLAHAERRSLGQASIL